LRKAGRVARGQRDSGGCQKENPELNVTRKVVSREIWAVREEGARRARWNGE